MNDTNSAEQFLARGIEAVYPSKEAFVEALKKGKKIKVYLGIDPTGPTLHMGHAIPLMKLSQLQKMGHEVTLLIGDFTAMIGDPTDKSAARKQLTRREVLKNCRLYKKQASTFLSFWGRNRAKVVYNSTWLGRMKFADVVNLASNMTVQQMIERDMFEKRISEKKPIFLHEFLYPLMQGYDSVALDTDGEIGGNDQTFNMLAGRTLLKSLRGKDKFVFATKLLVDPTGKKMGKTEGNIVALSDSPTEMFGKVMSWPDGMIVPGFELCTRVSSEEIATEKSKLDGGANPRDSKVKLAHAVVALYHGDKAADAARDAFFKAFSQGGMPDDAPVATVAKGNALSEALMSTGLIASKTEWRRLVSEKAVTDLATGAKIESFDAKAEMDMDIKVGKHRFLKIKVK
ncbi:MAG TPA: tyrosine--tRNA ligase [Candidatus Paceibacterota bacterium]|jgi:tyrosyl-tRNA synthetase